MPRFSLSVIVAFAAVLAVSSIVSSAPDIKNFIVGDKKSGYVYAEPETRAMEDDDFNNPAFLWVDQGKELWSKVEGTAGVSCASCHNEASNTMKGVGATYPKFVPAIGKVVDIEQRINYERTHRMGAAEWAWESPELLAMTAFVKLQSRGMPVRVAVDGPAHATWLRGKAFYETRRGQLDMACAQCHIQNPERKLRSEILSQGQSNGFPTYRLAWGTLGSLQRRFRECNNNIRAEPLPYGADDYIALELFVASRGNGLPVESPSVRK
jgi:sulfur-oxidizing protein SoxA